MVNKLTRYSHKTPNRKQYTPYAPAPVLYGKASQDMPEPDTSPPPLNAKVKLRFQKVVGSFLYYGRAVDMKIPASLRKIAEEQSNPTEDTIEKVYNFLNYMATNKKVWGEAMCTELGNISQGWGKNKGTNTAIFLTHKEIAMTPKDRIITYTRVVVD